MAYIENIWIKDTKDSELKTGQMRVNIKLYPSGTDAIMVDIPKEFYECLFKMAQLAADIHEQRIIANLLAK